MVRPDDDVQDWFSGLSFKVKKRLARTIKDEADGLRQAIEDAAPKGATLKLSKSVKVRRRRNDLDLEVTAGGDDTLVEVRAGSGEMIDRVLFPEYGTVNQPAQPFFFSTARQRMPQIRQNIDDAVAEAINS
jgi:HK97 gp10 family phage protein